MPLHTTRPHIINIKSMEAWEVGCSQTNCQIRGYNATKGKIGQSFGAQNSCEDHNTCISGAAAPNPPPLHSKAPPSPRAGRVNHG